MKSIYDYSHIKSVSAIALLFKGKSAGKIIANWSNNQAGSVCTTHVEVSDGPLKIVEKKEVTLMGESKTITSHAVTSRAGGGGYCKLSTTIGDALSQYHLSGSGLPSCQTFFEKNGYQWIEVI